MDDTLTTAIVLVAFLVVAGIGVFAVRRLHIAQDERHMLRIVLARSLRAWAYEANQGDGIDHEYAPYFFAGCRELGIVVRYYDNDERPTIEGATGDLEWMRYELQPSLTDWLQANEGKV